MSLRFSDPTERDDLGAFTGTAGTVNIFGTLNTVGATLTTLNLDSTRTWQLNGGTLQGVTVDDPAGLLTPFRVTSADVYTSEEEHEHEGRGDRHPAQDPSQATAGAGRPR